MAERPLPRRLSLPPAHLSGAVHTWATGAGHHPAQPGKAADLLSGVPAGRRGGLGGHFRQPQGVRYSVHRGGGPAAQKNLCVQGVCSQCQAAGELRLPSSRVSPPRDPPQLGRPQTQARPAGEGGSCAAPGGRGRSQDHSLGRATVTKCGQTEAREGRLSAGSPWAGHSRSAGQSHRAAPRAAILRWSAGWPHN